MISSALAGLPSSATDKRAELRQRQHELRAEAAALRRAIPDDPVALKRRLRYLRKRLDDLHRNRVNIVGFAGGSPGGDFGFTVDAMKLNDQIDESAGRTLLEDEIRRLEARLAELEG